MHISRRSTELHWILDYKHTTIIIIIKPHKNTTILQQKIAEICGNFVVFFLMGKQNTMGCGESLEPSIETTWQVVLKNRYNNYNNIIMIIINNIYIALYI